MIDAKEDAEDDELAVAKPKTSSQHEQIVPAVHEEEVFANVVLNASAFINFKQVPDGHIARICRVMGKVNFARGLTQLRSLTTPNPFLIIKAIRSNNNTSNIHMTQLKESTSNPTWNEEFDFEVPLEWGLKELVGLRVVVYDADDPYPSFTGTDNFLGGADIDLSAMKHARVISMDLEMGGVLASKAGQKKARVSFVLSIYKDIIPKPVNPNTALRKSNMKFTYIREVSCRVVRAKDLPVLDLAGFADPMCIVRVVLLSGEVREVHRTRVIRGNHSPTWDENFRVKFHESDQPILMLFDVFDEDDPDAIIEENGDHAGSAAIPLLSCLEPAPTRRKLWLQGASQRHESRLALTGLPQNVRSSEVKDLEDQEAAAAAKSFKVKTKKQRTRRLDENTEEGGGGGGGVLHTMTHRLMMMRRFFVESFSSPTRPILYVDIRTRSKTAEMPFREIYQKPAKITDVEDLMAVREMPDWTRNIYEVPVEIACPEDEKPMRGDVVSQDHIKFAYGVIHGATALNTPDERSKYDVYCVLFAVSKSGTKVFMHRTRAIKQTTAPNWAEEFYCSFPQEMDTERILMLVYGAAPKKLFGAEGDTFLGKAFVNVHHVRSGELINEEINLMNTQLSSKATVTSGFRPQPSVSVEVMLERRLKPCFHRDVISGVQTISRRSHSTSAKPQQSVMEQPYTDVGQMLVRDESQDIAKVVMGKYSTGRILEEPEDLGWNWKVADLKPVTEEAKPNRDREPQRRELLPILSTPKPRRTEQVLPPGKDFTKREPLHKSKSLPALKTKFGEVPPEDFFPPSLQPPVQARPIRWNDVAQGSVDSSFAYLRHKPPASEALQQALPDESAFIKSATGRTI